MNETVYEMELFILMILSLHSVYIQYIHSVYIQNIQYLKWNDT